MRYSRHYSDSFIGDAIGLVLFIIIFIVIILFDRVEKKKNRERCDSIKDFAEHSGLKYVESVDGFPSRYVFKFADIGRSHKYQALTIGKTDELDYVVFDFRYSIGSGDNRRDFRKTVCLITNNLKVFPDFNLRKERFIDRLKNFFRDIGIKFPEDAYFSNEYTLEGGDEKKIREFFCHNVRNIFSLYPFYNYECECEGDTLAVFVNNLMYPDERLRFLENCIKFFYKLKEAKDKEYTTKN